MGGVGVAHSSAHRTKKIEKKGKFRGGASSRIGCIKSPGLDFSSFWTVYPFVAASLLGRLSPLVNLQSFGLTDFTVASGGGGRWPPV